MPATPDGAVLAFDFGTRRIGIAVGSRLAGAAQPAATLSNGATGPDAARIDALVAEWRPQALLVGLPLALDGREQPITRSARQFAAWLHERYGLPVHCVDERYTSREADHRFATLRARGAARRKQAKDLDAVAAGIILEAWLAVAPSSDDPAAAGT